MSLIRDFTNSPGRTVLCTVLFTIGLGTLLLALPISQNVPIPVLDCFFTATSSTCVTGVLTIPLDSFTRFGQCVILGLIQVGGIGLITMWLFLVSLFFNLGLSTHFMLGRILELSSFKNPREVLFFIIGTTITAEVLGTIGMYMIIKDMYSPSEALFHASFHSISMFCNAGLSSFGDASLIAFRDNLPFLALTGVLIFLGGIGFTTLHELLTLLKSKWEGKRHYLSLTTRVVLTMTTCLIISAAFLLYILEGEIQFYDAGWWKTISNMLFNAIAYRSTGLTTIDVDAMQTATIFFIIMYSFIGSSPVSTGSGIKVTTFAIFLATIRAVIRGRMEVDIKNRRIPEDQIFKAMAILSVSISWIIMSSFLLALCETSSSFMNIFFEAVSSFTNLGLATSITTALSVPGKWIIILSMFMGRVGTLTLMLALKVSQERTPFHYPEERLMIS